MKASVLTTKQLEMIFFEDFSKRFEVKEKQECINEYKNHSSCEFVFEDLTTNLIYKGRVYREGSYYTDYYWESEYCNDSYILYPLEEIEVVVKKKVEISKDKITETEDLTNEGEI